MPGGLFAPLLLVGAAASALLAGSVNAIWPATLPTTDFAVVGMAAFFTAVVRTPFTGIMLVAEMTERADLALPLLVASLGAILTSTALGSEPIYDTLRSRMPANDRLKPEARLRRANRNSLRRPRLFNIGKLRARATHHRRAYGYRAVRRLPSNIVAPP
jgi:H+/Cl- antiporter ClcA